MTMTEMLLQLVDSYLNSDDDGGAAQLTKLQIKK